ncbi:hypothetical protein SKP52_16695 [Sphingopyxis fribergensis]|uniref:DUF4345 domain-containing protein n=1 Tax=Sphingopyxis fribergensis TaxID=1515612 RepID=A0A0A7PLZ9_9SPHN|nr:hypothetical protein [Sphingopyxis fribergensis]AJA10213.1 hypothetical protein SKP52_16695 [Sphingopyxis fribergensis]
MVNWVLRGAVLLWALLFVIVGARGLFDPASYSETFGIVVEGVATNTIRADLSAFFLVAAAAAVIGALVPGWLRALLVPAALYGTALAGRLFGVANGDAVNSGIVQAMIIEALTVLLMVGSWWVLSRPQKGAGAAEVPGEPTH